ncbi:DNA-binding transcriptional regulator, MurR/RpiR family, contains HTH and SIS domains [Evansella caseinilytica]|uniref:DNA-binding transcriptional regulator, MurR/RpiR family, contains HTH and SIS domains n=1 Tax=Evansella caseinilytica TaxID=1503961 RepID=A0A1H3UHW4_9BACI|nr:MurR/RpiR family transcriptional regulator [Evansella caseinilytica]SDZ61229.1 DNA-binding transcriptional regulator, MurR/RpiR family, contains HTH and SIS domains [Evansella caseinilytica]
MSTFSILKQIERQMDRFTDAEKTVADYVTENAGRVTQMSTKELAAACGGSEAAIIRFCKRLGIQSFKTLKIELAKDISANNDMVPDSPLQFDDDASTIIQKVMFNTIQALHNTEKIVSVPSFTGAVEALSKAERVYLYGVGGSAVVAEDFKQKLLRIGVSAFQSADNHLQMMMVANAAKHDTVFLISTSGKTKEIIDVLSVAKEREVRTILLTQHAASPARRLADIVLTMSEEEQNLRIGTMTARIAQLAIIDALFIAICSTLGQGIYERIIHTHEAVQRRKS